METEIQHYEKYFFGFIYGGHKGRGDVFQKDVAFMKAILEKDESTIREWFDFILQPEIHKLRVYSDEFNSKYLSLPGAKMLKLCWHLGMEFHIDSPYIPMELMPFKPLPK